jgi:mannosyltransferase OCH1-like enzyme
MRTTIPKIIHQIWIQGEDEIPKNLVVNKNKIKELHPDWEYVLWDEISIIELFKNTNKEWFAIYYKFDYLHQKIDYVRLIILYVYGGIYIDMDAYTIKKLDNLINKYSEYDLIVSYAKDINFITNYIGCRKMSKCLNNGVFIAKPKADILNYLINNVSYKCYTLDIKENCILHTTGPMFFDKYIFKYINTNEKENKSKILMLNNDYFEPCALDICDVTDNTYIKHEHTMTWFNSYAKEFLRLYINYTIIFNWLFILLIIFILYLTFFNFSKYFPLYKKKLVKRL